MISCHDEGSELVSQARNAALCVDRKEAQGLVLDILQFEDNARKLCDGWDELRCLEAVLPVEDEEPIPHIALGDVQGTARHPAPIGCNTGHQSRIDVPLVLVV